MYTLTCCPALMMDARRMTPFAGDGKCYRAYLMTDPLPPGLSTPKLSTSGGTSDARFIKDHCPVLEFGLVGATMHQVDERTSLADLATLTAVYRKILDRYFG